MHRVKILLGTAALLASIGLPHTTRAQDTTSQNPDAAAYEVHAGTRFMVALETKLSTKDDKARKSFTGRTLESITAANGTLLPAGTEVRGHIDKVVPAAKTGRAKLWLTFDDIKTPDGWMPLVAGLIDTPGIHSLRVAYDHEGEIEVTSSNRKAEEQAVAAGALVGAATGMAARNTKDAAIGAAIGAATAFMVASGLGQELTLDENTKLELILERPLRVRRV